MSEFTGSGFRLAKYGDEPAVADAVIFSRYVKADEYRVQERKKQVSGKLYWRVDHQVLAAPTRECVAPKARARSGSDVRLSESAWTDGRISDRPNLESCRDECGGSSTAWAGRAPHLRGPFSSLVAHLLH
jgi:hypothetical protein